MTHARIVLTAGLALLLAAVAAEARIYKTVDEHGNVVFTDVPPSEDQQAVELSAGNRYTPVAVPAPTQTIEVEDEDEGAESPIGYERITIASPANDEPVRENAGNLTVDLNIYPPLNTERGHQVALLMDGQPYAEADESSVSLTNIDRGTHTLQAQVIDASGNVLATSPTITFHMLRVSVLTPARPAPRAPQGG